MVAVIVIASAYILLPLWPFLAVTVGVCWLSARRKRRQYRAAMAHGGYAEHAGELALADAERSHETGRVPDALDRLLDDVRIVGGEEGGDFDGDLRVDVRRRCLAAV